ncbi:hypothetical protein P7K49_006134, partial [Saguinus oedipus]
MSEKCFHCEHERQGELEVSQDSRYGAHWAARAGPTSEAEEGPTLKFTEGAT